MSFYRGMTCENVTIKGDKGTPIIAYVAKPWSIGLSRWCLSISRAGASSTSSRVGLPIMAISRSAPSMGVRARGTRTMSPPRCATRRRHSRRPMSGDTEAAVKWMRAVRHNGKVGVFFWLLVRWLRARLSSMPARREGRRY